MIIKFSQIDELIFNNLYTEDSEIKLERIPAGESQDIGEDVSFYYSYDEFLNQFNIENIRTRFEIMLNATWNEYYLQDCMIAFNKVFHKQNTELSQKMYCINFIKQVNNANNEFSIMLKEGQDNSFLNNTLNDFQKIAIQEVLVANISIVNWVRKEYKAFIEPQLKFYNFNTIIGRDLDYIERLYEGLKDYDFFEESINFDDFMNVLKQDASKQHKIRLKVKVAPEFYFLVKHLMEKSNIPKMKFYEAIVDRVDVVNIRLSGKGISTGISALTNDPSRQINSKSEMIILINNLP
ncbi:hypothetical protein M2T70_13030 [Elizabethkingia anophelis]|uniref:hypothetical protein n=1 Tax=Elizabethkingia anophelis TaxID=1117645 RepID=UPI000995BA69|nr:hypothetical protein [Elizabethkingia anophelis]AQW97459.1 hypothetical protein BBD31_05950 [Elizabethkingia anophelis]ASV77237.1 hypothetical protein A6J37_00710 [Elizabethkingia anophelis]MCL1649878.1 hypothetical protein [Elizabethkingia anophelis]MCL1681227.1 hypothetical protein [Elizabethkingia anophelis]MDV3552724.1 hypothetical protein [Elizabethkingia anophelis]